MKKLTEKEAIKLLRKYAKSNGDFKAVLSHSKKVRDIALDIAKKIRGIDLDFIKSASLLHDIGRFEYGPESKESIKHGIMGAEILRKEGLLEYALIAERHLGAGISKEDIVKQGLGLPLKNYVPVSKEEKIIAHADNLVSGYKKISIEEAVERFSKEVGKKIGKGVKKLAEEVEGMSKG